MKKTGTALALSLTASAVGVFAFGGTANAVTPSPSDTERTVKLTIENRLDSGQFGNWAKDTFERTVQVNVVSTNSQPRTQTENVNPCADTKDVWTYEVSGVDKGAFTTITGRQPAANSDVNAGAVGTMNGTFKATVKAAGWWCDFQNRYNGAKVDGSQTGSTGDFLGKLFKQGPVELNKWEWAYNRCDGKDNGGETWVNAKDGNSGNITGVACAPKLTVAAKCDTVTGVNTVSWTLTNSDTVSVKILSVGPRTTTTPQGSSVVQPGKSLVLTDKVADSTVTSLTLVVKWSGYPSGRLPKDLPASVKLNKCEKVVPPPANNGGTLPLTGVKLSTGIAVGVIALMLGGAAMYFTRRRKVTPVA